MIRKIFSIALFLIVVVGCSQQDGNISVGSYDSDSINFVSQTTKATSCDIGAMEGDANGFIVYGVEASASSWYENLGGNSYIYDSTSQRWEWESDEAPLWPEPFNQMNFYAYYPASAAGFTITDIAATSIVGDIVVESTILDQTDYLASSSGDVIAKPLTGMQPLNFAHIMSKISFSVLQSKGVLTVIRQLGIENIIDRGSYDYMNSEWCTLSKSNLASFDDYVGSSGPFAKYGVEDQIDPIRIDGHYLMLIPQEGGDKDSQTPLWDGSITVDDSGELIPNGAYISIRYRTSLNSDTEDVVGYAIRAGSSNETEWAEGSYFHSVYKLDGGSYTGPLYVKAGFKLTSEQLSWVAGAEYDYNLQLDRAGGIYLSEYYHDVDGKNTKIRVTGAPKIGDPVYATDIGVGVTVNGWNYIESEIYPI